MFVPPTTRVTTAGALCVALVVAPWNHARAASDEQNLEPRSHQAGLSPSALVQRAGTFALDLNGPLLGLTLAPINRLQLQVAGFAGVRTLVILAATAKVKVLETDHWHATLTAGYLSTYLSASFEVASAGLGGVVTRCLPATCASWLSVLGGAGYEDETQDTSPRHSVGWYAGVNGLGNLTPRISLLAELMRVGVRGVLGSVAVRFHGQSISVDLGMMSLQTDAYDFPPLPWLALTYRVRSKKTAVAGAWQLRRPELVAAVDAEDLARDER